MTTKNRHERMKSAQERELRRFLDTIPGSVAWRIEPGSKHSQLIVADKLIGVLCHTRDKNRDAKQLISAVKRRLRELEGVPT
jgi:hypothetical protein